MARTIVKESFVTFQEGRRDIECFLIRREDGTLTTLINVAGIRDVVAIYANKSELRDLIDMLDSMYEVLSQES